jgi:hypothetical protein
MKTDDGLPGMNPTCSNPHPSPQHPSFLPLLALFQKRIEGDDALLHLASLRFREAGLGPEFYAETAAELNWLMGFRPTAESPVVVHLNRDVNVLSGIGRRLILDFASTFSGRLLGLVIHDQPEMATRQDQYAAALKEVGTKMERLPGNPLLFVEYAAGLEPELFLETLRALSDCELVTGCLDVGHLGLWRARRAYSELHPGADACSLTPQSPELPLVIDDLQSAVRSALNFVLEVIHTAGRMGKPLHFHLHDGHPLSTARPFGVSDHLSFLEEIPIPFEHHGGYSLPLMFGPSGLTALVSATLRSLGPYRVSFSLEIHPAEGRLALGDASPLFRHWVDKTNAERMNYWLTVLLQNHQLLKTACRQALLEQNPASKSG